MPVTGKRPELLVGIFLFIGLSLLAGLIVRFGRFEQRFGGFYRITVVFDDASGVIKGSDVLMGGARIGEVASEPVLNSDVQVEVELDIQDRIQIPMGSSFQINSATLLGDKLIVVMPPPDRNVAAIEPGSRLRGAGPAGFDAIQNNAEIVTRDVRRILERADVTMEKIDGAVNEIQVSSKEIREAVTKVNQNLLARDNLTRFDTTMTNLADISAQWKQAGQKIDPTLVEAREAIAALKKAATAAERTLDNADATITSLKPAFEDVPEAVGEISRTARKAGYALDRMEEGEGLLGAVASDNDVSTDAKVFVRNLRRYGILRYRNEEIKDGEDPRERFRGKRR